MIGGTFAVAQESITTLQRGPRSGDLYREYSRHARGDKEWRVTDRRAVEKFDAAKQHLPNAKLSFLIEDLEFATRAEVLLDRWGGHRGTINKRIRFNDHDWITAPEIQNTPAGIRPEQLMFQDNPVVAVPVSDLSEGENVFEADCDEAGGFGWGQWGLYSMVLRVYYDPDQKTKHRISGRIVSPSIDTSIQDNPIIEVEANAEMGVSRIDVLASYDGYDEDGDGIYTGFHKSRFQLTNGEPNQLRDHVGTVWKQPYRLRWKTDWVPDQPPYGVSLVARIQDSRGYSFVTQPSHGITLARDEVSVKLYKPIDVPEDFSVRVGETKQCRFEIPCDDDLTTAIEAGLHLRTWHGWDGHHEPLRINDHAMRIRGKNHFYDYDLLPVPTEELSVGTNTFTIHSKTQHHMLEVLWPGPAIVVRYRKRAADVVIRSDHYEDRDHFVIETKDLDRKYWFLYEGPIAGRWAPQHQYFATDTMRPITKPHSYYSGDRVYDMIRWAYVGDTKFDRVLAIVHEQNDQHVDQFSHLGDTTDGLESPDGMVVLGFGRGGEGIDPLLTGSQSFQIRMIEQSGRSHDQYDRINALLQCQVESRK